MINYSILSSKYFPVIFVVVGHNDPNKGKVTSHRSLREPLQSGINRGKAEGGGR